MDRSCASQKTDLVPAGGGAAGSKLVQAQKLGMKIVNEGEFHPAPASFGSPHW
jgi:NAD-dependent DNA ligase